jgi:UDP-3-O-[3-hydroxymyristoyl] glucosamine N-acyltransferase
MVNNNIPEKTGVAPNSSIDPSAKIGEKAYIGAFAVIEEKVVIGNNCKIYPQVYIGSNVTIGDNTVLYPGVKIYRDCVIGSNCIIHSGAVIGADGFGFSREEEGYRKIPQTGNVIIEDNVEIGANTTIDRAVMGSTIIHRGVKLDNLIQIAHNCEIGQNTAMAAQVGIAGSTKVGENCVFGGQVGLGGHITIGNNVQIGAQSGIISNIKDGSEIIGSPAMPVKSFFRSSLIIPKLPDMYRQLNALEKEIESLKKQLKNQE